MTLAVVVAARMAIAEGGMIVQQLADDIARPKRKPLPPLPPRRASVEQLISFIIDCERQNRRVAAALALVELRQWHEADPLAFAEDERSWRQFAAKRLPLHPTRVESLMGSVLYRGGALACTACGTVCVCRCGCGAAYAPQHPWAALPPVERPREVSALERAIAAVRADPTRSNRRIAAEIHVHFETVRRARQEVAKTAVHASVDASVRVGRDGRRRRLPGAS